MAGFLPDEGETMVLELILQQSSVDRGTNTELVLFTNASPTDTITAATLTEPYATAGGFVIGKEYIIVVVGTTDFTAIGASANTIGVKFTSTGLGTGTGTGSPVFTLTDASWSAGVYAQQIFNVAAGGLIGSVVGYAIRSIGGTADRIITIEIDSNGPFTFIANDTYEVTPTITAD